MWSTVLRNQDEQQAFTSLLSEYFDRPFPSTTPAAPPRTAPRHVAPLPPSHAPTPARAPPPSSAASSVSSSTRPSPSSLTSSSSAPPPPASAPSSFSTQLQNAAAGAALRNTSATSSALRQAGLSSAAANSVAGFGAKHSSTLAPHVATAARHSWNAGQGHGQGGGNAPERVQTPVESEAGGPKKPAGLMSSKSMAGVGDTSSGKNFTKALFSSKGALSKAEQDKNKYQGPLYVKPTTALGTVAHAPPPRRGGAPAPPPPPDRAGSTAEERVKAAYDFEGSDAQDLPVIEGEELVVVERVSSDWIRCRNARGAEGLVPTSYTQPV
ncbi:hypothetical protein JCM10212_006197 [Sporobolomyces blumeae]